MSQEQAWTLEEMARTIQAERLAAAEKHRRLKVSAPISTTSPRMLLAGALRWLASLVDEKPAQQPNPERRLVRAF